MCFEHIVNLIKLLKTTEFKINRLSKSNLGINEEIGYTPIKRKEATSHSI